MDRMGLLRLQVAMAFGQGAGTMLASLEALEFLVSRPGGLLERAATNWESSRFAFVELMRVAGQIAAARAAIDGSWEIQPQHLEAAIQAVMSPCPCRADTSAAG